MDCGTYQSKISIYSLMLWNVAGSYLCHCETGYVQRMLREHYRVLQEHVQQSTTV